MARRYNEGKTLDAVLRFIEARDHALRKIDGCSPDDLNDPDEQRRVDYVCRVGQTLYAFEHTGIEPFHNQIEFGVHNDNLFRPIVERFDHRPDQESWTFHVPVDASAGLARRKVGKVQDALTKWIEGNVGRIPVAQPFARYVNRPLGESDAGVPFPFSLHRTTVLGGPAGDALRGSFRVRPFAPADLERQRTARLRTACGEKYPKLARWKHDSGARTVIVLEDDDLWATNHFLVSDALAQAEATTPDAPDEAFLVSTGLERTWWVVCLRGPGVVAGEPMPHRDFNPMELTKLTSR
jgi:hypothetical protein